MLITGVILPHSVQERKTVEEIGDIFHPAEAAEIDLVGLPIYVEHQKRSTHDGSPYNGVGIVTKQWIDPRYGDKYIEAQIYGHDYESVHVRNLIRKKRLRDFSLTHMWYMAEGPNGEIYHKKVGVEVSVCETGRKIHCQIHDVVETEPDFTPTKIIAVPRQTKTDGIYKSVISASKKTQLLQMETVVDVEPSPAVDVVAMEETEKDEPEKTIDSEPEVRSMDEALKLIEVLRARELKGDTPEKKHAFKHFAKDLIERLSAGAETFIEGSNIPAGEGAKTIANAFKTLTPENIQAMEDFGGLAQAAFAASGKERARGQQLESELDITKRENDLLKKELEAGRAELAKAKKMREAKYEASSKATRNAYDNISTFTPPSNRFSTFTYASPNMTRQNHSSPPYQRQPPSISQYEEPRKRRDVSQDEQYDVSLPSKQTKSGVSHFRHQLTSSERDAALQRFENYNSQTAIFSASRSVPGAFGHQDLSILTDYQKKNMIVFEDLNPERSIDPIASANQFTQMLNGANKF